MNEKFYSLGTIMNIIHATQVFKLKLETSHM